VDAIYYFLLLFDSIGQNLFGMLINIRDILMCKI